MSELFTLRAATEADVPIMNGYAYCEGMDNMPGTQGITVAESVAGDVVGFLRIAEGANGVAHVNPIVVAPSWRGWGVGRALMEDALMRCGELRLVSRGTSRGFYEKLGYKPLTWDDIDKAVVDDCDHCELFEECHPVPMGKKQ